MIEDNDALVIADEEEGLRLDKILAARFSQIKSRTYFHYLFEEGKVFVNGRPVKKRHLPQAGDEVDIEWICSPALELNPEPIPLDIIYEDEAIIVVNKPAGMVVHPAAGNWSGTFVNGLLYHCQKLQREFEEAQGVDMRPGIVHRLDKDTTGLLVAAKTALAHQKLVALFASREIDKHYLALCLGNPGNCVIDMPIGRHLVRRKEMAVCEEGRGRRAVTICQTLAFNEKASLVSLKLVTGRTHQLRVHLKAKGTPILGDCLYGNVSINRKYGLKRQMLHAFELSFSHPIKGHLLHFKAPLPGEMLQVMRQENLKVNFFCSNI